MKPLKPLQELSSKEPQLQHRRSIPITVIWTSNS